ncbi:hypothetical protein [Marinobacter salicampi]|uniref:hypothetical protein n=1 Tax=Marinobacter salicampi TaxID=435907 RepID=UPI001407DBD3|nr:hypothetical protein [Marinobacter salicampi]
MEPFKSIVPPDPNPDPDVVPRPVHLGHHDSVRSHVFLRLSNEVSRLERRIDSLRGTEAPHVGIIIATYQRMIDRKKGFMERWGLADTNPY